MSYNYHRTEMIIEINESTQFEQEMTTLYYSIAVHRICQNNCKQTMINKDLYLSRKSINIAKEYVICVFLLFPCLFME